MDVRIGIAESPQSIDIEMARDTDRDALKKLVDEALVDPASVLWLQDRKGKEVAVPASQISFVQISSDGEQRIGFGAAAT